MFQEKESDAQSGTSPYIIYPSWGGGKGGRGCGVTWCTFMSDPQCLYVTVNSKGSRTLTRCS